MTHITTLLPWIVIPLLGAVIGYVTNSIAITMLFRPYFEKRIFKIRVPFTPGIIPKQRYQLAESIGNMVSKQLLTEDAVKSQTGTDRFRDAVNRNIGSFLDRLLTSPLSLLGGGTGQDFGPVVKSLLNDLLKSDFIKNTLMDLVERGLDSIGDETIDSVLRKISTTVPYDTGLSNLLASDVTRDIVLFYVDNFITVLVRDEKTIGDYLKSDHVERFLRSLDSAYPQFMKLFIAWLNEPKTKSEITFKGRILLRALLQKLSGLQRFFVTAAQYDRTIDKRMDEIVEDVIREIEESVLREKNKDEFFRSLSKRLKTARETSFIGVFGSKALDVQRKIHEFVANLLDAVLNGLSEILKKHGEGENPSLLGGLTVRSLITRIGGIGWEELKANLAGVIGSDKVVDALPGLVDLFKRSAGGASERPPLNEIIRISDETRTKACGFLTDVVINLINREIPAILETIDVKKLVVDKINSLDVRAVEQLLLQVLQRHFKWINLFGGILGALIGVIQVIVTRVIG